MRALLSVMIKSDVFPPWGLLCPSLFCLQYTVLWGMMKRNAYITGHVVRGPSLQPFSLHFCVLQVIRWGKPKLVQWSRLLTMKAFNSHFSSWEGTTLGLTQQWDSLVPRLLVVWALKGTGFMCIFCTWYNESLVFQVFFLVTWGGVTLWFENLNQIA